MLAWGRGGGGGKKGVSRPTGGTTIPIFSGGEEEVSNPVPTLSTSFLQLKVTLDKNGGNVPTLLLPLFG